jgi:hypothetical protein
MSMKTMLGIGDRGDDVLELQKLLAGRGYPLVFDGEFGSITYETVRAFQSQNVDQHGNSLVVDGLAGPVTLWSLQHAKPDMNPVSAVDYDQTPPPDTGGSAIGRITLLSAIGEMNAGACELGGNNCGPFVRKYLKPAGLSEGNPWCAAFVSWCQLQAQGDDQSRMLFSYSSSARSIMNDFQDRGWAKKPQSNYVPLSGDLVFWWRVRLDSWQGHIGIVHQVKDGMLYTIEGNKTVRVQGFSYVLSRMEQLLGFGHMPDD